VPDENGSLEPLRKYSEKTLVIVLPGELTIFDIGPPFLAFFLHTCAPSVRWRKQYLVSPSCFLFVHMRAMSDVESAMFL